VNTVCVKYVEVLNGPYRVLVHSGPVIPLKKTYDYYTQATEKYCMDVANFCCISYSKHKITKRN